jgi:hypothetical protein
MHLGYRPYHMAAAYPNAHEEFPCWTEALQLKFGLKKGTPWGRAEFDKLTGSYDVSSRSSAVQTTLIRFVLRDLVRPRCPLHTLRRRNDRSVP